MEVDAAAAAAAEPPAEAQTRGRVQASRVSEGEAGAHSQVPCIPVSAPATVRRGARGVAGAGGIRECGARRQWIRTSQNEPWPGWRRRCGARRRSVSQNGRRCGHPHPLRNPSPHPQTQPHTNTPKHARNALVEKGRLLPEARAPFRKSTCTREQSERTHCECNDCEIADSPGVGTSPAAGGGGTQKQQPDAHPAPLSHGGACNTDGRGRTHADPSAGSSRRRRGGGASRGTGGAGRTLTGAGR